MGTTVANFERRSTKMAEEAPERKHQEPEKSPPRSPEELPVPEEKPLEMPPPKGVPYIDFPGIDPEEPWEDPPLHPTYPLGNGFDVVTSPF
jgi:hypothetical protein